ncbi:uncharacterized protein LOC129590999 [Paramacrobiotus metropolitanus]|uniref:uncharacterized protein LOC129590999 n=1 Tax=Paramacrobiotus metropolitanus TaxID=2943436 RepID=UPI00244601B1|nr:uncharacterized protein LOC129590999 [Paramacrobiotus metropolitanus]
MNAELSALAATCSAVVWRDCDMSLSQTSAHVAYAKFCLRDAPAQRLTQLWDVYEMSLVSRAKVDVAKLAEWVTNGVNTQSIAACSGILWALNEYIGADPRTVQHGAFNKWTLDTLVNLDVFTLSKVAQFAFYHYVYPWPADDS